MFVEKGSPIKVWIKEIEDRNYEIRGWIKEHDEGSHEGDDGEEEACLEDTELEGNDIYQEEDREGEARFDISLDDIFNTERDISRDISLEGLHLNDSFLL
ncbi:uncharacterized protein EAF01_011090 [Botrytis porri]|uniref:uncharacterized protein n=1 Tax=Botrytis porri TaxID=87229 RepID=UPI0018FFADFC|nr:uncharacterized protein EAF01_011090 [Botrytis porri]KAF7887936.1 hypothetical protein EAF01_011090 [Botrytis porri]